MKVHKFNPKFAVALCEGTKWVFTKEPKMSENWSDVTCKRCLKLAPKRKGKR